MNNMIAFCGLDCGACEARKATGALTVCLQWVAADAAGERRPTGMVWVVAGVAVLGICHWTGLLGI